MATGAKVTTERFLDGKIRDALEESIRFLSPGTFYSCSVDEHAVAIMALAPKAGFLVVCTDCKALVAFDIPRRRVYLEIHKHTKEPVPNG